MTQVFLELWESVAREAGVPFAIEAQAIRNDYYGGDVNVTGLIVSCDLLAQLPQDLSGKTVLLPEVMFNFDKMTLDGDTQAHVMSEIERRGGRGVVSVPSPAHIVESLRQS